MANSRKIIDRESEYQRRRYNALMSPARDDPYLTGDQTPANNARTYTDVVKEQDLRFQKEQTMRNINQKKQQAQQDNQDRAGEIARNAMLDFEKPTKASGMATTTTTQQAAGAEKRRNRWDQSGSQGAQQAAKKLRPEPDETPAIDQTPGMGRWDATPGGPADETPAMGGAGIGQDQTPAMFDQTPN